MTTISPLESTRKLLGTGSGFQRSRTACCTALRLFTVDSETGKEENGKLIVWSSSAAGVVSSLPRPSVLSATTSSPARLNWSSASDHSESSATQGPHQLAQR